MEKLRRLAPFLCGVVLARALDSESRVLDSVLLLTGYRQVKPT